MDTTLTERVKEQARALGFDDVGVAPAQPGPHAGFLDTWLARGHAAGMAYLARDPEKRKDPRLALPGARSVIVCALAYGRPDGPGSTQSLPPGRAAIARFARDRDYHLVIGEKLERLLAFVRAEAPAPVDGRAYVDTGPVLEREAAALAGLGRFGKNAALIHPSLGSRFFIGVVLVTTELEPDAPIPGDPCGNCRHCLNACPTGALCAPYELDARRCLSYLTIEHRGAIPPEARGAMGNRVFGCDACHDACPWNRRERTGDGGPETGWVAQESGSPWEPAPLLGLLALSDEEFSQRFRETPLKRAKRRGLRRNLAVALGNWGDPEAVPGLAELLRDADPLLRAHAAWALGRIGSPEAVSALRTAIPGESDREALEEIRAALNGARE